MGYLFLVISLLSSAVKNFLGKKIGKCATNTQTAVFLSLIRMMICALFSALVVFLNGDISYLTMAPNLLFVSIISGLGTSFFVVSWIVSVKRSAYMLLDVFMLLGTIIPIAMGFVVFSEPILVRQVCGLLLLLVAAFIMCSYSHSLKNRITLSSMFVLIACGVSNGITDFSQKYFVKTFPKLPVTIFNFYTYVFAVAILSVCYFFGAKKQNIVLVGISVRKSVIMLIIMALALLITSQFKTMAAAYLDSAKLYPFHQGVTFMISIGMSTFFFKERFTRKAFAGVLLAVVALLIMNL